MPSFDDLNDSWVTGQTMTAAQFNQYASRINEHSALFNSSDRALGEWYRPLQGVAADISESIAPGLATASQVLAWYDYWKRYRYCGCEPEAVDGDPSLSLNNNNTVAQNFGLQPIVVEFWSNSTEVRVHGYQVGRPDFWCLVDDMRITPGWVHGDFNDDYVTWTITQPSAQMRKWRICIPGAFSGLSFDAGALVVPTIAKGPQIAVVGDSLVQGNVLIDNAVAPGTAGYINSGAAFGEFEQYTGLDVWRCGIEGTGYVNQATYGVNGPYGSAQRVAGLAALPEDMDVVIAFGTVNDGNVAEAALVSAANDAWTAIAAAQPTARLVVVGMEHIGPIDTALDAKDAALRAAAAAHPNVSMVIDVRTDPFITGTGYDGNPQGDGNQDGFAATDATHPNHAGHRYWAEQLVRMLSPAPVPN